MAVPIDRNPTRPTVAGDAWPSPRRSPVLAVTLLAMLGIALASGAYMLWHRPLQADTSDAARCATAFDARLKAARRATDAVLMNIGKDALAARCGDVALAAYDNVEWEVDEPAAWALARFYDPAEADPAYRDVTKPDPHRAAEIYLAWRDRSPRQAAALSALCAKDSASPGRDPALAKVCVS